MQFYSTFLIVRHLILSVTTQIEKINWEKKIIKIKSPKHISNYLNDLIYFRCIYASFASGLIPISEKIIVNHFK